LFLFRCHALDAVCRSSRICCPACLPALQLRSLMPPLMPEALQETPCRWLSRHVGRSQMASRPEVSHSPAKLGSAISGISGGCRRDRWHKPSRRYDESLVCTVRQSYTGACPDNDPARRDQFLVPAHLWPTTVTGPDAACSTLQATPTTPAAVFGWRNSLRAPCRSWAGRARPRFSSSASSRFGKLAPPMLIAMRSLCSSSHAGSVDLGPGL
jgi:hypothetical protein